VTRVNQGSYEVRADLQKNILYLRLEGFLKADQIKAASEKVRAEAARLRPGFGVITEMQHFMPASQEAVAYISDAQKALQRYKPGRVIRVVSDSALASMQFNRTSREAGYQADTAPTRAEAERMLAMS